MTEKFWYKLYNSSFHNGLAKFITGTSLIWTAGLSAHLYNNYLKDTEYSIEAGVFFSVVTFMSIFINAAAFVHKDGNILWGQTKIKNLLTPFMKGLDLCFTNTLNYFFKSRSHKFANRLLSYMYKNRKDLLNISFDTTTEDIGGLKVKIIKHPYNKILNIQINQKELNKPLMNFEISQAERHKKEFRLKCEILNEKIHNALDKKAVKSLIAQIETFLKYVVKLEENNTKKQVDKIVGIYHNKNYDIIDSPRILLQIEESKQVIESLQSNNYKEEAEFLEKSLEKLKKFTNISKISKNTEETIFNELLPRIHEISILIKNSHFLEKEEFKNSMEKNLKKTIVQISNIIIQETEKNLVEKINDWENQIKSYEVVNEKIMA